uniref:Mitochondrial import inner membrane translocase subunit TIM23 n=1 Tax=Aplanochytrium stocchinoi TaxID=215587 RepID=A0A6S8GC44_9STRA|mmetsp:Transcript_9983/g.12458  ORF Transcript_9983/g.12458 Transcript_9983/m.12458 type:complete len:207 (+) Transcript_9983:281-901(+)|eukprot:CAMPEP_0204824894 /NCGR_PEP_ID=MMETSP1346-20131115/2870_1 /ASSEMBLY_ACC=CAM_ASM_000771 /TAXON_ID=215587 /ORGANISM="Aplanochytrium stocchinoi, Strain GSBS06" /LENGTH=206 /DNA_ID=CAMNT_0051952303 /DNA_START=256 /DNA_END=876 /DNA_ORIENTATION=+
MEADKDQYEASGPASLGMQDPEGYSYTAPNPFLGLNSIDPKALNPMIQGNGPEYLQYDTKGRGYTEKTFYNCGTMYLLGIVGGGTYGFFEGLRSSPSNKFKIRLNTVLNKCGRRGSRAGNALGALALMYSLFDALAGTFEIDHYLGGYDVNPLLAATATGLVYKSTHGPKTMALAAVIGGGLVLGVSGAKTLLPRPLNSPSGVMFF